MRTARLVAIAGAGLGLAGCGAADTPRRATSPAAKEVEVPTGHIVFRRYLDPQQTRGVLVTIAPDGTGERQITHPKAGVSDDEPAWSPDGGRIAFSRCGDAGCEVWTARPDGSAAHRLDPARIDRTFQVDERSAPDYSPDGRRVAFGRGWGRVDERLGQIEFSDLYVMSARGRRTRRLTTLSARRPFGGDANGASWSPNGSRVAFQRINGANGRPPNARALYVVQAAGGRPQRITRWRLRASDPDWSPAGARIVFQTVPPGEIAPGGALYTVRPDGTGLRQLIAGRSDAVMLSATFSPDGQWIAFARAANGRAPDIYVMRADGSGVRRVTTSPQWDSRPAWGP